MTDGSTSYEQKEASGALTSMVASAVAALRSFVTAGCPAPSSETTSSDTAKRKFREIGEIQEVGTRKTGSQRAFILGSAISDAGISPTISGGGLVLTEPLPGMRVGKNSSSDIPTPPDARMVFEYGRWFLCIPETVPTLQAGNQGRVMALDAGIRSFQTFFLEMTCGQIGTGDFTQIVRLAAHLDDLLARLDPNRKENRINARKRYAMHRAAGRIRDRVDELHWKTCRFLVRDFDVILIPSVQTKDMALKCKRKIRTRSVRSLLTFSHYRFKQRSKNKASEFGKVAPEVDEGYTSKTANWTGEIKKIGGAKCITTKCITTKCITTKCITTKCITTNTSGGFKVGRDINDARGIFLRALADRPEILAC
jgi:putative transposase